MKKTFKSNSDIVQKLKNLWFALQLLIVSVSLPVMCFIQVTRGSNSNTQQDKVINNSVKPDQTADGQNVIKLTRLS